ncbi:hypothetical protein pVco7_gp072 [Vibrio phage pVco-7]
MSEVRKAITATDKSTKALGTAVLSLSKIAAEIEKMTGTVPAMIDEIGLKQGELDSIAQETELAARNAKVDLDLRVRENEDKVLADLMKKRGYATITNEAVATLERNLETANADNAAEVAKAVQAAVASKVAEHKVEIAALTSQHDVASATAKAEVEAASAKIKFLEEQVTNLRETITAEREARVQEAEARAKSNGVTVNNSK